MKARKIKSVASGSHIYNAADKPGHERGDGGKNKPKCALIYSVVGYDGNMAICESWDIMGRMYNERLPAANLVPYSKEA